MNKSELTPLWKAANNNLLSISSTIRTSLLKQVMKDRKLSFSPYSMVSRLDEKRLCLCPPIKLLTNSLLNSSKYLTVFKGILLNHTRAGSLRVVGKCEHTQTKSMTSQAFLIFFRTQTLNLLRTQTARAVHGF